MANEISTADAILSLCPQGIYTGVGDTITWDPSYSGSKPTDSEIAAERSRLQGLYDNRTYQRTRKAKYKPINEQLDELWHDINDGKLDKDGSWYKAVKAVKDSNPKP